MRDIIGREYEINRLKRCLESDEAQLIGVYGRRRVGKTFLVNRFFGGRFDFMITGVYNDSTDAQLSLFIDELNRQWGKSLEKPNNWREAFILLREYINSKDPSEKVVIFFDEIPWLDSARSDFMLGFESFWNGWGSMRDNLVFVISGSATSWLKKNIDANKGGFYRRLTCRLFLMPFSLKEVEQFLIANEINWSRYDIAQLYMIMGGIPYYLQLLDPELSLNQNIDNIFFRKRAELWDEFAFLYRMLFKNSEAYIRIVEALCTKRSGLCRSDIAQKAKLPENGVLTEMLNDLEYSGFIRINTEYGKKKKIYQISDYYTMFYFRFIRDNYGKDEHFWANLGENPAKKAWLGLTFEQVCKDHYEQIRKALGISGVLTEVSTWSYIGENDEEKGAQIDMVIKRNDRVTNLCEIKFSGDEYTIDNDYERVLRNKIDSFSRITKTKDTIQLTMISTYGVKKGKHSNIVTNQVLLDDLFL